ncbi:MAG: hypothetical protein ACR2JY_13150 [Chloroflexota bacterium]
MSLPGRRARALLLCAWVLCGVILAVLGSSSAAATVFTGGVPLASDVSPDGSNAPPANNDPLQAYRAAHPDALWPHWFSDHRLAWGSVGLAGGGTEGLIATDGTLSPNRNRFGLSVWLRDNRSGVLLTPQPDQVTQSLAGGDLPLVTTRWTADGATLSTTVFAASDATDPTTAGSPGARRVFMQTSVSATGTAQSWTLYVALRPFGPAGGSTPLHGVSASPTSLSVDGALAIVAQTPASRTGALNESAIDASVVARAGAMPTQQTVSSDIGMAEGMLAYDLTLGKGQAAAFNFVLPMQSGPNTAADVNTLRRLDVSALGQNVRAAWQARLHHVQLTVGDRRVQDAFYASLGYIFMAQQGSEVFSGTLSERAFWFRDAAYITNALDEAGYQSDVQNVLRLMASTQLPSGRYPPIILADGMPQLPLKTEWDTQGQVIFALVDFAKQNHDLAFLHNVYPGIWAAARFQEAQLAAQRIPALQGTPFFGILPAGESAEDLYNADWRHYWDDFWAMTGFQEAATAARMLGFSGDAGRWANDETALRAATIASVNRALPPDNRAVISNGPEDRSTTAMARSGTPAIWPVTVLDPASELVQHSFDTYYIWDIKPYGGAYQHYNGTYWPFAGISLAHAFYRLGMLDHTEQILEWTLSHQTAPNLYAWADIVDPATSSLALGDMPHSWMAAEMVLLIRDMLVRETGQAIAIGPMPEIWLLPGGTVSISGFPTVLGHQSYRLTRSADGTTLNLTLSGSIPPGGYVFQVSDALAARSYALDGGKMQDATSDAITVPAGTRSVMVMVKPR